jgi:nickel/cobalt transporter (NicO) family protein
MMAGFIVAIRGTLAQAVLLSLAATISHTAVVWAVALGGMYFGGPWDAATSEPYLKAASAVMIIGVALWIIGRQWYLQREAHRIHHHHDEAKQIDTGHGIVRLEGFEDGVPPRFRIHRENNSGHVWAADQTRVETIRPDGSRQTFTFLPHNDFLESEQEIPEPHQFNACLSLGREHSYAVEFIEHDHRHHGESCCGGADTSTQAYRDAHEKAHADDIRRRFANKEVTTGQIVLFGLTGGLVPCPASITVLVLCLQLKRIALGAILVLSFSIGLALTMTLAGSLAALSVKHVSMRWHGFDEFSRKAPYFSGTLILLVGLYVGYQALLGL